jgi:DHA2 family multidrug resistance protein
MIRGLGVAVLIAPLTATAMNAVPKHKAGMASSMLNIIQQIGGSIGIAVLSLVLHRRSVYHTSMLGSAVSTNSPSFQNAIRQVFSRAHELGHSHAASWRVAMTTVDSDIAKAAAVRGFQDAFLVGSILTFVVLAGVFLLPNRPLHHASTEPVHLE